jgi:hypothetical protein
MKKVNEKYFFNLKFHTQKQQMIIIIQIKDNYERHK